MTQEEQQEDKVVPLKPDFQQLLDKSRDDVEKQREQALMNAAKSLEKVMADGSDELKHAGAILFGLRLVRWAVSKLAEHPDMNSTMLQLIHNSQAEASGEFFDFVDTFKHFKSSQLPWLQSRVNAELEHVKACERRTKKLTQLIKNKKIPIPLPELETVFEEGMEHDDTMVIFAPSRVLNILSGLFIKAYMDAGGWPIGLLMSWTMSDEYRGVAGLIPDGSIWKNTADTTGTFTEMLRAYSNAESFGHPSGLLVVEDLDNLLAGSPMMEPRPVRLVRAMGMLHQYQFNKPTALVVGISTDKDTPAGVTPAEIYPPFLMGMPHIHITMEDSELVAGSKNVKIGDESYVLSQLEKKLS